MALSTTDSKFYSVLFDLISTKEENETEIINLITNYPNKQLLKEFVNKPIAQYSGEETMLMWAVWRLKDQVVTKLLEVGADPLYKNKIGDSVSTYWNDDELKIVSKHLAAFAIIRLLDKQLVSFSQGSGMSWSLIKRSREHKLIEITNLLKELGYRDDSDFDH